MNELNKRIDKGIEYFWDIKPSEWTSANTVQLKIFLQLVEKKRQLEEAQNESFNQAKKIFETNDNK